MPLINEVEPAGIILVWSGAAASVPLGWLICDGTNGTPNLRDFFIQGAGGALIQGNTGGALTHAHGSGTLGTTGSIGNTAISSAGALTPASRTHVHAVSGTTANASSLPPYIGEYFIIKT